MVQSQLAASISRGVVEDPDVGGNPLPAQRAQAASGVWRSPVWRSSALAARVRLAWRLGVGRRRTHRGLPCRLRQLNGQVDSR